MANDNEPAKLLLPYLQRADELQKHEPLVAYYCRLYAMERGMKIPQSERTKYTKSLLISLMNQLEKDKKSVTLAPDDNLHLEGFALNVFGKADKQDRAGRADLSTAKTFYAASIFFEILNQFGEVQPDLEQKQKYAAWKAADIRKALKEGRKPEPGPPGGDKDAAIYSSAPDSEYDLETSGSDTVVDKLPPESDLSTRYNDRYNLQHSTSLPPSHPSNIPPPAPSNIPQSPPSYPTSPYSSNDFHPPPPPPSTGSLENYSSNPELYHHHQPYAHEPPQHHMPQNYASYPSFQSYPSGGFTESNLPAPAPSHYPSYYQGSDAPYQTPPPSTNTSYPSTTAVQHDSGSRNNGTPVAETVPTTANTYHYDVNYQPPPEKVAEAHKAARFAVGALAFDDVYVAVDYLKKSLELLTNPSAGL